MDTFDLSRLGRFSRGKGNLVFGAHSVVKKTKETYEPYLMQAYGGFAEVLDITKVDVDEVRYTMPRYIEPDLTRDGEAIIIEGIRELARSLWNHELAKDDANPDWRDKLVYHLVEIIYDKNLKLNPDKVTTWVGNLPPDLDTKVMIHGDATLANMVYDPARGWIWVDPLMRPYIPYDPRVDLGKCFQTCWGYEQMILGRLSAPALNERLCADIVRRSSFPFTALMDWCVVHLIRLLPYQTPYVRSNFEKLLREHFNLG